MFFFSYIFIFPYYHKLPLFQPMSHFIPEFAYGVANGKSYTEKLHGVKINCCHFSQSQEFPVILGIRGAVLVVRKRQSVKRGSMNLADHQPTPR